MWQKTDKVLYRKFKFKSFDEAAEFIDKIISIAKRLNHHPKLTNSYDIVEIELSTHSKGSIVTKKDEAFADEIDKLFLPKSNIAPTHTAKLYTDGGSRGNPGPSAMGIALLDENNNVILKTSGYLGITTNNQAEYQALIKGLEIATSRGIAELSVFMDSELIIKQLNGQYKVKKAELIPHYHAVKQLEKNFDIVTYSHVRREYNQIADSLVNDCLDRQK